MRSGTVAVTFDAVVVAFFAFGVFMPMIVGRRLRGRCSAGGRRCSLLFTSDKTDQANYSRECEQPV